MALEDAPAEDSGVMTMGWYRYQHAVTAARCIELLLTGATVVIEWHTDCVVIGGDIARLVSVKHREPGKGAWTISSLCDEGDLGTLRKRWMQRGKIGPCELLTNAGFSSSVKSDARTLVNLLAVGNAAAVPDDIVARLAASFDCSPDEVREFLDVLTITTTGGDRETIDGILVERAVRPVFASLGIDQALARKAYRAVLSLVQEIASGCGDDAAAWAMKPITPDEVMVARSVDAGRVVQTLAAADIQVDLTVENGALEPGSTRLMRKLRAGGLGPTVLKGAPALRANWYAIEAAFREDLPGAFVDEIGRARQEVLSRVMDVESRLVADEIRGPAMHVELTRALAGGVDAELPLAPSDLMGCAYQLTDECTVWWSKEFDPSDEAPWVAR